MRRAFLRLFVVLLACALAPVAEGRSRHSRSSPDKVPASASADARADEKRDKDGEDEGLWEAPPAGAVEPPDHPLSVPAAATSKAQSGVRISGVLFDGRSKGRIEADEAVRLVNMDPDRPADVGGFFLSDRLGPSRGAIDDAKTRSERAGDVVLPAGASIPAGGEIWIAYDAKGFRRTFGFDPDYEAGESGPEVPKARVRPAWPMWSAVHGVVSLHDAMGEVVDLVPYERSPGGDAIEKRSFPSGSWSGPSVLLFHASPFGWTGQVLARDRSAKGVVLNDTDTAEDWDSSFSHTRLGRDELHRVEWPGQSRFFFPRVDDPNAEILAASAPENGFNALRSAIEAAKKEILVHIYQFENDHIADLLVAARRRGVLVTVACEGSPVGGLPDQERYIVEKLHEAGVPVWFIVSDEARGIRNRYRFDHSKYLLIDGEKVIIATENFGYSGHPLDPSYGNRGWMIHVRSKPLYRQLRRLWDVDVDPAANLDLVEVGQDPADRWGFPYRHPPFKLRRTVPTGHYGVRRPPLRTGGPASFELVACPDNCLSESGALIGMIGSAMRSLLVLQNSIPLWWGKRNGGSAEETPNLPLMALVEAARRGVRVRVLLDGTWYNTEPNDPRDNDDTARWLNELASREKLDLAAKVVNLASTELEKIHAKGIVADGRRTFVGSINWTENSFKANREIGLVVDHAEVAAYYSTLFQRDWDMTRLYRVQVGRKNAPVRESADERSAMVANAPAGELMDVVSEKPGFLEVRLSEHATGYLRETDVESRLAVPAETPVLIGRSARVRGRVLGAHAAASGVFLNFGLSWKSDFSVFIPSEALPLFRAAGIASVEALAGREIEVAGQLYEKDGPQLRVEVPGAIRELF